MQQPTPQPVTRGAWLALIAAYLGWLFDGYEMGIFALVARPALRELLGPTQIGNVERWYALSQAGFLVGAATGGVLFGWLGDWLGRVRALMLSILVYALITGACGLAQSSWQLAMLRSLAALGMGGEWALGVALVMELWPNRSRAWLAGLIGSAVNLGFVLVACLSLLYQPFLATLTSVFKIIHLPDATITFLTQHSGWRLFLILSIFPAGLVFFIRKWVPESERWLAPYTQSRLMLNTRAALFSIMTGAACAVLVLLLWAIEIAWPWRWVGTVIGLSAAAWGFLGPLQQFVRSAKVPDYSPGPFPATVSLYKRVAIGCGLSCIPLIGTWAVTQWLPLWADELTAGRVSDARSLTMLWSALGATLSTLLLTPWVDRLGRRLLYAFLCVGALTSLLLFLNTCQSFDGWFLFMNTISGFFVGGFYGWLALYLPELYPTPVRALAQGFAYNFGRIIAAAATLQTGALLTLFDQDYPLACSVVSMVYLLGIGLIGMTPSRHEGTLPE